LTYGELFEAIPFDNGFAIIDLTGKDLRALVTRTCYSAAPFYRGAG